MSMMEASGRRADGFQVGQCAPVPTITGEGLVLGTTLLAPIGTDAAGISALMIDGAEARILALLSAAYGKFVGVRVLDNIRRAARYWRDGEAHLAAIELALSGLPPLPDPDQGSRRLDLADRLLAAGLSPCEVLDAAGLDPGSLDKFQRRYNPDQPRVPAGNPDGGQWTGNDEHVAPHNDHSARPSQAPPKYTDVLELPAGAKAVIPPDGIPIPDESSPTKLLMAPAYADYREVYAAGRAIASLPLLDQYSRGRAAIGQEGTFNFQRDGKNKKFYSKYVSAANYAAGVYMAGAGQSLDATLLLAKFYAMAHSKNYTAQDQLDWIKRGWTDAASGRWR